MSELDRADRAIIRLLMEDGRMSSAEIARRIGDISERSVRYRVDRLIKEGVIQVSAITHPRAVGFEVMADVWIEIEAGRVLDVARKLAEFEQVSYVGCSTGERDLSLQVYARNNAELYQFVTEVIGKVPGVRKTSTILVPLVLKDVYDWHIPEPEAIDGKGGEG
jgi:Lrp/AsnC family transcriptional regulator, regulator for asnA, asnC and gidA